MTPLTRRRICDDHAFPVTVTPAGIGDASQPPGRASGRF